MTWNKSIFYLFCWMKKKKNGNLLIWTEHWLKICYFVVVSLSKKVFAIWRMMRRNCFLIKMLFIIMNIQVLILMALISKKSSIHSVSLHWKQRYHVFVCVYVCISIFFNLIVLLALVKTNLRTEHWIHLFQHNKKLKMRQSFSISLIFLLSQEKTF